jgi:uncharacterized surface protein with fasciclin (FAS1) repeats
MGLPALVTNQPTETLVSYRKCDIKPSHFEHGTSQMTLRATHLLATMLLHAAILTPVQAANIVDTAASAGQFKTLLAAAKAAGLADALSSRQGITVFAPSDAAFAKLPKGTVESLLRPENKAKLQSILLYHVLPSEIPAADVPTRRTKVATLNAGREVAVRRQGQRVHVDKARVVKADIQADNGTIHVIDRVLIPAAH